MVEIQQRTYLKLEKVTIAIGIGMIEGFAKRKHLYVSRHKLDRSRFGVDIATDFDGSLFYDSEETEKMIVAKKNEEIKKR